jgi:type II secretory pathway component PulJ
LSNYITKQRGQIKVSVIADSISHYTGSRAITFELEYPRMVHSELMTHRMFSRNSASSRAIPVKTMLEQIRANPAEPVHWGKNQAGMQAKEELDDLIKIGVQSDWKQAMEHATFFAESASLKGAHRLTEPFQIIKIVLTATERNNWYWLRNHPDADPTIAVLAELMLEAENESEPVRLFENEWHAPYVDRTYIYNGDDSGLKYFSNGKEVNVEEALRISASMCAQVSYRKSDDTLEKADKIFKQLIETEPCHASPVEHQLKAIDIAPVKLYTWQWPEGVTHVDRRGNWWSGNTRGFIQHRQLIPENSKYG